jgi:DNA replication and repair protein RecF
MPGEEQRKTFHPVQAHRIQRLTLTDFRNYAGLRLDAPEGLIALAGPNGAGKTNLLEAISLLTPGRGLRGAEFDSIASNQGKGAWAVSATVNDTQLGTAWKASEDEGFAAARAVLIDGHLQKSSGALAPHLRIVWLTPALDRLFSGAASDRRRYLDRMVALFDIEHGSRINRYEKLMRERNQLLSEGPFDKAWATSIETQMAEEAIAIAAARLQAVSNLGAYLTPQKLAGPFPWSTLTLEGDIETLVSSLPALEAEERYRKILADGRNMDKGAGRTLVGPHRSDLKVTHGPKSIPAAEGSTGEQKALLIGLILAQTEAIRSLTGMAPVLLLDEIAAHLDKARRTALFAHLERLKIQAWMTGTEPELFDGAGASTVVYQVEHGHLSESKKH